ncbi:MAG: nucleotide exchange factor GrpE [Candidatus Krumholzibacteriia bacterium]
MTPDREWDISESEADREPGPDSQERAEDTGERDGSKGTPGERDGAETAGNDPGAATAEGSPAETHPASENDTGTGSVDGTFAPAGGEEDGAFLQKRTKRARRKELLDLIQRKNAMLMELDKELKETKQHLVIKEDRLLRMAAEFENYKKRTRREWELLQKNANADLIKEIIWGIDNFDRAFASLGGAEDHIQEGIRLIHAGLMDILKKAGLMEIEAQDRKFDAQYHEAVGEIESYIEEGHVAQVIQRGYTLHDQVLRPARVLVSKKRG